MKRSVGVRKRARNAIPEGVKGPAKIPPAVGVELWVRQAASIGSDYQGRSKDSLERSLYGHHEVFRRTRSERTRWLASQHGGGDGRLRDHRGEGQDREPHPRRADGRLSGRSGTLMRDPLELACQVRSALPALVWILRQTFLHDPVER